MEEKTIEKIKKLLNLGKKTCALAPRNWTLDKV